MTAAGVVFRVLSHTSAPARIVFMAHYDAGGALIWLSRRGVTAICSGVWARRRLLGRISEFEHLSNVGMSRYNKDLIGIPIYIIWVTRTSCQEQQESRLDLSTQYNVAFDIESYLRCAVIGEVLVEFR